MTASVVPAEGFKIHCTAGGGNGGGGIKLFQSMNKNSGIQIQSVFY